MMASVVSAVDRNDVDQLSRLLGLAGNNNIARDALFCACIRGKLECVKWLVDVKNVTETTEIIYAVANGHYDIVQYLLARGRDANVSKTRHNCTPLHYSNCPRITNLLIQAGADVHAYTTSGDTPLSVAVRGCKGAIALTLLQYGARLDYASDNFIPPWATKMRDDVLESQKAYRSATIAVMTAMRKRGAPKDLCAWFAVTYMKEHRSGDDWL